MKTYFFLLGLYMLPQQLSAQLPSNENVVKTFYQDAANNCASVAIIKAAMCKYGYNKVVSYTLHESEFKIKYRNNEKITVTEEERQMASEYARFWINDILQYELKDSVVFYACLYYACIAKYIEAKGYWGCEDSDGSSPKFRPMKNYERALKFISRVSYCTDNAHRLLGLSIKSNKVQELTNSTILPPYGVVLYSWKHAVVVFNGTIDCYGDWKQVSTSRICGNKFEWYVELD